MPEKMAPTEIVPGVYAIKGRFAGEFGFISSYLVVEGEEALVIDPGTAGDPGEEIVKGMVSLGLNPKKALSGILCTHGHPDHAGGAARLRRSTGAQIMIHSGDVDLLQDPRFFIKHRLRLDAAERLDAQAAYAAWASRRTSPGGATRDGTGTRAPARGRQCAARDSGKTSASFLAMRRPICFITASPQMPQMNTDRGYPTP
jgi:glyoxylase-like metal-dependent hydrolase (beta-lactamase superfamily II)